MKPSVIVALLVGVGIGFAVGRVMVPSNSGSSPTTVAAAPSGTPTANNPNRAVPTGDNTVFKVPLDGAYTEGKPDALVTMVEFSDY